VRAPEVHDALAALARDLGLAEVTERLEQRFVEREAAREIGDDEVEMVDRCHAQSVLITSARCANMRSCAGTT
jgi:hypothetical protein